MIKKILLALLIVVVVIVGYFAFWPVPSNHAPGKHHQIRAIRANSLPTRD